MGVREANDPTRNKTHKEEAVADEQVPTSVPEEEEAGRDSLIVDVSQIPITDLATSDDSVLANSIRRVLADLERATESISGWSSYIE